MLSGMLGVSPLMGWLMHFMIGIIFAVVYVYLFNPRVHLHSRAGKGLLYGIVVFVFAQVMMFLMRKLMPMPSNLMENNLVLMMIGSLIDHLVFGLFVGLFVPLDEPTEAHNNLKHRYKPSLGLHYVLSRSASRMAVIFIIVGLCSCNNSCSMPAVKMHNQGGEKRFLFII
jgi:hypothetical protein